MSSTDLAAPPPDPSVPRSALDLRRAIVGRLIVAGGPVTITALVDELTRDFGPRAVRPKRVADVLRYQVGLGRVRRVRRGVYEAVPGGIPKATAWRCVNWQRAAAYASERARREAVAHSGDAGWSGSSAA